MSKSTLRSIARAITGKKPGNITITPSMTVANTRATVTSTDPVEVNLAGAVIPAEVCDHVQLSVGLAVEVTTFGTRVLIIGTTSAGGGSFQTGDYKEASLTTAQPGWLYCDGTLYLTTAYPDLFAKIGYTYGGSGSYFAVPDRRGTVGIGVGSVGTTSQPTVTIGGTTANSVAGSSTHALTSTEMAAHTHTGSVTTGTDSVSHSHVPGAGQLITYIGAGSGNLAITGGSDTSEGTNIGDQTAVHTHTGSFTTASAGSGSGHNNVQPITGVGIFIKT